MPQQDNEAAELEHGEEVGFVIFPAAHQPTEVVKPGEEAFDFPASAITAQFAAFLGVFPEAIVLVGCDEPEAVFLPQTLVERIAVIRAVADHSFWFGLGEALLDGGFDQFRFMRRSAGDAAGDWAERAREHRCAKPRESRRSALLASRQGRPRPSGRRLE